jgi:hypothetical protein
VGLWLELHARRIGVAEGCPDRDWSVWNGYEQRVPGASLEVIRTLFERFCVEIRGRGLPWRAARYGQTVGFKATPGGEAFKVALHSAKVERGEFKPASFLIHPVCLSRIDGYRIRIQTSGCSGLPSIRRKAGACPSLRQIPDVRTAVDLALKYGKP